MSCMKRFTYSVVISLCLIAALQPDTCEAKSAASDLFIVPADKLPSAARHQGVAMELHLVNPGTLYLYIEQDNGCEVAVFDVSDPHKIKVKNVIALNAPSPFDFIQPIGQFSELIRYRDGSGTAVLDLSKAKSPRLKAIDAPAGEAYIIPISDNEFGDNATSSGRHEARLARNYKIVEPSAPETVFIVKDVVQQQTDEGNGTTYLLGADGLTVVRSLKTERRLAATAPAWTNTTDDN
jgi:hypothetical protein